PFVASECFWCCNTNRCSIAFWEEREPSVGGGSRDSCGGRVAGAVGDGTVGMRNHPGRGPSGGRGVPVAGTDRRVRPPRSVAGLGLRKQRPLAELAVRTRAERRTGTSPRRPSTP